MPHKNWQKMSFSSNKLSTELEPVAVQCGSVFKFSVEPKDFVLNTKGRGERGELGQGRTGTPDLIP